MTRGAKEPGSGSGSGGTHCMLTGSGSVSGSLIVSSVCRKLTMNTCELSATFHRRFCKKVSFTLINIII